MSVTNRISDIVPYILHPMVTLVAKYFTNESRYATAVKI